MTSAMGAKTIQGIRFNIYSNDHNPPHVDAEVNGMKMKIYFSSGTTPPQIGQTNPRIKNNDVRRAFEIFCNNELTLLELFEEVQNAKKD